MTLSPRDSIRRSALCSVNPQTGNVSSVVPFEKMGKRRSSVETAAKLVLQLEKKSLERNPRENRSEGREGSTWRLPRRPQMIDPFIHLTMMSGPATSGLYV